MGKIIAVAQHKGGTGKTTTCINLGASLCDMGKTVLVVDLDPQASFTLSMGINPLEVKNSIHQVLVDPTVDIKSNSITNQTPLDIAKERYAKGEINKDQFMQIKKDLED